MAYLVLLCCIHMYYKVVNLQFAQLSHELLTQVGSSNKLL